MIEIVFGKTAIHSLRRAGKNEKDIYCFDIDLSVGNLMEKAYPDLTELRTRAENGEPLRVWYSQAPHETCGFYWLMSQLEDSEEIELHGIQLPSYYECANGDVILWKSWAAVSSEEWSPFLAEENPIPRNFRRGCAWKWQELAEENAPLRAVVNGRLVSVPVQFYDHFLQKELDAADIEFREPHLIGQVIGKYQFEISDAFLAQRMEEWIKEGKLEVISSAESRNRILKKIT